MLWRTLLMGLVLLMLVAVQTSDRALAGGDQEGGYIKVEVKGTLKTGIVAIGGETTGTTRYCARAQTSSLARSLFRSDRVGSPSSVA